MTRVELKDTGPSAGGGDEATDAPRAFVCGGVEVLLKYNPSGKTLKDAVISYLKLKMES